MMSRCFTWSPSGYMSIHSITSIGLFYKNWGFYLEGDCEELVGVLTGDDGDAPAKSTSV